MLLPLFVCVVVMTFGHLGQFGVRDKWARCVASRRGSLSAALDCGFC